MDSIARDDGRQQVRSRGSQDDETSKTHFLLSYPLSGLPSVSSSVSCVIISPLLYPCVYVVVVGVGLCFVILRLPLCYASTIAVCMDLRLLTYTSRHIQHVVPDGFARHSRDISYFVDWLLDRKLLGGEYLVDIERFSSHSQVPSTMVKSVT